MGKSLAALNVIISAKVKDFDRAVGKIQRDLSKVGKGITTAITLPVAGIGIAAIKSAGDFEMLKNGLEAIMGSADAAAVEMAKLQKEALKPGLAFEQAVRGSVKLQAVGFSADQARDSLAAFGNALALAGGSAADLDGVSLALTQIESKGKVMAQEINQLAERVPQIRAAMKGAFGTADTEVLQKMGMTAKEFVGKVTKELQKLPTATGGINNAFENVQQTVKFLLISIGDDIATTFDLKGVAERLQQKVSEIIQWWRGLDKEVKRNMITMAAWAAAIGPALWAVGKFAGMIRNVISYAKIMGGMLMGMGRAFMFLVSPIGATVVALGAIAAAVLYVKYNWDAFSQRFSNIEWWKSALYKMADFLLSLNIFSPLIKGFNALAEKLGAQYKIVDPFEKMRDSLKKLSAESEAKAKLTIDTEFDTPAEFGKKIMSDLKSKLGLDKLTSQFNPTVEVAPDVEIVETDWTDDEGKIANIKEEIQKSLNEQLKNIDIEAGAFGTDLADVMSQKAQAVKTAIQDLIKSGTVSGPMFERLANQYKEFSAGLTDNAVVAENELKKLSTTLKNIDANAKALGTSMDDTFAEKAAAIKSSIQALIDAGITSGPELERLTALYKDFSKGAIEPLTTGFDIAAQKAGEMSAGIKNAFTEVSAVIIDLSGQINDALTEGFQSFGDTIGQMMAGAAGLGDLAKNMAMPLINLLSQVGDMVIQTGVGMLAIKKVLKFGNPFAAIAVGVAIKALAGAVKSKLSQASAPRLAKGGLAYGETLAVVGDNPGASANPEVITPLNTLDKKLETTLTKIIEKNNVKSFSKTFSKNNTLESTRQIIERTRANGMVNQTVNHIKTLVENIKESTINTAAMTSGLMPSLVPNMAPASATDYQNIVSIEMGETRIKGSDLYISWNTENKRQKRIY